jgi:tetratricopeptide (TPR) repeat protein
VLFTIASIVKFLLGRGDDSQLKGIPSELRKQVRKLQQDGDFLAAGELLFEYSQYEAAAACFSEAKNPVRAAESQELAGNTAQAIALHKRAGNRLRAAELHAEMGQFEAAALEMLNAGAKDRAADYFAKGGQHRRAGEIYDELGQHLKAAKSYQDGNDIQRQMEAFVKAFEREFELTRGNVALMTAARAMASQAAEFFSRDGNDLDRGVALYIKAGYPLEAAKAYANAGRYLEAGKLYQEAGMLLEAASTFESVGEHAQAAQCRAQQAMLDGNPELAANTLITAGQFERAADIYIDQNQLAKAAQLFQRAKKHQRAAELLERAGDLDKAAKIYETIKEYNRAAELFSRIPDRLSELRVCNAMEDFYRAGRILIQLERFEEAVETLRRVDPNDPRYAEAMELQGDILARNKLFKAAFLAYRDAFGEGDPNASNIQLLYKMGRCAEGQGEVQHAEDIYGKVMRVDPSYRDIGQRIGRIQAPRAATPGTPPQLAVPIASAVLRRPARVSSARLPAVGVAEAPTADPVAPAIARPASGGFDALPATGPKRYEVLDEIARGGMGVVYQARDALLSRIVAFKVLSSQLRDNDVAREYFIREARAAANLNHPNIVTVYDAGVQDGEAFMAMEYIDGFTLKQVVSKEGPLPEKLIIQILRHVCAGLQYAHERGVVHRDIKSGNIMIARQDRRVKILDFGLAKVVTEAQQDHTQAIGTPFYMSPEQILGNELDQRSDIYSLGVTIYELITGTVPFFKGDLAYKHVHEQPPPPRSLNPSISTLLEGIILKCMEKSPANRYPNCADISREIRGV